MAREKPNFREMLAYLQNERHCPDVLNIKQTAAFLGKSRNWVYSAIASGEITAKSNGQITVGAIANYLLA